ncbi:MAG: AgmX/PglI C-terminal domain-containing protein [Myxococcota bacterium]|nr:AgmX/PglI C-terminal domain-containing protein [Myxococcota bacterium]
MRTYRVGLLASFIGSPIACGSGQGAREGSRSADTAATAASFDDSGASIAAPFATPSGGTTTTTETLEDARESQGTRLVDARTVASTAGNSPPSVRAPHSHDPGRGAADIRAIVLAHRDETRACYDNALPNHPGIEGDLYITWTIDPQGDVTQTSVDQSRSTIGEPRVTACILEIVKRIQFAPSPGGFETKAYYPFNFRPHHHRRP